MKPGGKFSSTLKISFKIVQLLFPGVGGECYNPSILHGSTINEMYITIIVKLKIKFRKQKEEREIEKEGKERGKRKGGRKRNHCEVLLTRKRFRGSCL